MHDPEVASILSRVQQLDRRGLIVIFEDRRIVLQGVDHRQFVSVTFELDGHAHLPAWISTGHVPHPGPNATSRGGGTDGLDQGSRGVCDVKTLTQASTRWGRARNWNAQMC